MPSLPRQVVFAWSGRPAAAVQLFNTHTVYHFSNCQFLNNFPKWGANSPRKPNCSSSKFLEFFKYFGTFDWSSSATRLFVISPCPPHLPSRRTPLLPASPRSLPHKDSTKVFSDGLCTYSSAVVLDVKLVAQLSLITSRLRHFHVPFN